MNELLRESVLQRRGLANRHGSKIGSRELGVLLRRVRMNFGGGVNCEQILEVAALVADARGWTPDELLAEWVQTRRRSYAGLMVNESEE
jgi:hypothetical protein